MLDLFSRKYKNDKQLISVIEYPDKLVFETYFRLESWVWKRTDIVSVTSREVDETEIYHLILKHLDLSKSVKERRYDFDEMSQNYCKIVGLNSIKSQMKDAKMVEVFRNNADLTFTPMRNGGATGKDRGYTPLAGKELTLAKENINIGSLNDHLRRSLENCQ